MQRLHTDFKEINSIAVDRAILQPIATRRNLNDLQTETSREIEICLETSDNAQIQTIETVNEIIYVTMNEIVTEVVNVTEKKTEIDTIRVLLHTHETEVTMNLKANLSVQSIITAWLTQLYFTNNKKSLLLKTLFEHLQSGSYLRDKKEKAEDKSSQGKYS